MKKIIAFTIAALTLLAVSCTKETTPQSNRLVKKTFTVIAPETTKTELSGLDVLWSDTDTLNVIAKGSGNQYEFLLSSGEGTKTATFSGSIDQADAEETEFYAVYPNIKLYTALTASATTLELKKAYASVNQPALAVENGFDPHIGIMTAVLDNGNFAFRHAVAYLKLTIGNDNIKSIKISSSGGARIFGRVQVSIESGAPTACNGASSSTNFINLAPKTGTFVKDSFYLVPITIKPNNSLGSITLLATDTNDVEAELTHSFSSLIPQAGKIYNIGTPVFDFSTAPKLTLNKSMVQVEADAATGLTISGAYTIKNCADADVTVTYDGTTVTAASIASGTVTYSVSENTGEAREGWIGLNLAGEEVQKITVSQKKRATSASTEYVWNFTTDHKSDINVSDESTYKYTSGAISAVTTWTENNVLYLSPNKKAIKTNKKQSSSDKIYYYPLSYGGSAAYLFFNTNKSGTLYVTAAVGKPATDGGDCKLGILVDGLSYGTNVDLSCYDASANGLGAMEYSWTITNTTGNPQKIQIVKVSGANSPWIFAIKFVES
ncbi:MAG: hypothetical protein J5737_07855 [Bacteroidales bacterium]|nr:hypothetical protein [Bacteroidales bacterium]